MLAPMGALGVCVALAIAVLWSLGYAPGDVAEVFIHRVIWADDPQVRWDRWAKILENSTPLLLAGLSIAVAFRASVWNIGAQGQYVLGVILAGWIGWRMSGSGLAVIPVLLLGATFAGALWGAIAAALEWWRKVPVVLSTLLLNFVAFGLLNFLLQGALRDPLQPGQSPVIHSAANLPIIPGTRLHIGFLLALIMAILVWFILSWTTFGFRLRIVGENPIAARFAGINVPRVALATMAFSGALAGLAGGVEVAGVTHKVFLDAARVGYGFTAIAVALLARLSPIGVVASAIFFGLLNSSFSALQIELGLPYVTGQAIQGAVIIAMLVMSNPQALRKSLAEIWRRR